MTEKIKELIETAIGDGVLEPQEIAFLRKKAVELGDDPDEVEMTAKTELARKSSSRESKTNFDGEIKKCIHCGAILKAFTTKCPECGNEIRGTSASKNVTDFTNKLMNLPDLSRSDFIRNYPVPNTKEDMTEFITICHSNITSQDKYVNDWLAKSELILNKAKILFSDDPIKDIFLNYENKIINLRKKIKKPLTKGQKITKYVIVGVFIYFIVSGIALFALKNMFSGPKFSKDKSLNVEIEMMPMEGDINKYVDFSNFEIVKKDMIIFQAKKIKTGDLKVPIIYIIITDSGNNIISEVSPNEFKSEYSNNNFLSFYSSEDVYTGLIKLDSNVSNKISEAKKIKILIKKVVINFIEKKVEYNFIFRKENNFKSELM